MPGEKFVHGVVVRDVVIATIGKCRGIGKIPANHIVHIPVSVVVNAINICRIQHTIVIQILSGIHPQLPL